VLLLGSRMQAQLQLTNETVLHIDEDASMTIEGSLYKKNGQRLEVDGTLRLGGDWRTESHQAGGELYPGKVELFGNASRLDDGGIGQFGKLEINNTSVWLDTSIIILTRLILNDGELSLNRNQLTIANPADTAIVCINFGTIYAEKDIFHPDPNSDVVYWMVDTFTGNYKFPFGNHLL
jgi:hypothetical protein